MNDEQRNKLESIKEQVLDELVQLSDASDMSPDNKFRLMINLAISSGNPESFAKAKQAASEVEDASLKAQLLMELIEEIDISLGNITVGEAPEEKPPQENVHNTEEQSQQS